MLHHSNGYKVIEKDLLLFMHNGLRGNQLQAGKPVCREERVMKNSHIYLVILSPFAKQLKKYCPRSLLDQVK